jgi:enamine deaminase RidA (YjgF/YER057c/UK114 family)
MFQRLPGKAASRSGAAAYKDLVFVCAMTATHAPSLYEQTKSALADLDAKLAALGSDKSRILSALVYITDMAQKDEMNRAWDEWADRNNPPVRACLGVALTGDSLVEIVATAVKG